MRLLPHRFHSVRTGRRYLWWLRKRPSPDHVAPWSSSFQNSEKCISVVYKPFSLWAFVIAAQMDKDTHSNHTNRHFQTEERPGERGNLSFYLTFFWCKAGHPCKCSLLAWWGWGTRLCGCWCLSQPRPISPYPWAFVRVPSFALTSQQPGPLDNIISSSLQMNKSRLRYLSHVIKIMILSNSQDLRAGLPDWSTTSAVCLFNGQRLS